MTREEQCEPVSAFRAFGFLVLRRFFDPGPLSDEIDAVLADIDAAGPYESDRVRFQYVPMMTEQTPASLALLDRSDTVAATLLGGSVLPTRAKGARYWGDTPWHADSDAPLASIGFLAYLDATGAETGALRVLPGSHRPQYAEAIRHLAAGDCHLDLPGVALPTEPGDLIVLDERLWHASIGGRVRRQWRVDFLRVPVDHEADRLTRQYFAGLYAPDWIVRYDAARHPSYGSTWKQSSRPAVAHLAALGVYELAEAQEARRSGQDTTATREKKPP
jgi:hypothetical protein